MTLPRRDRSAASTPVARALASAFALAVVGLTVVGWLAACGEVPVQALGLQRLRLQPVDDAPDWPAPVVVERFDLADGSGDWLTNAPSEVLPFQGGPSCLRVSPPADGALSLRYAGPLEPGSFDELAVMLASGSSGRLLAVLQRGGEVVAATPAVELPTGGGLVELALSFPARTAAEQRPFDGLVLAVENPTGPVWVRQIDLVRRSAASRLPGAGGPARLIDVGGDGRRGWGLLAGHPVGLDVEVPDGARLSFYCALPPLLADTGPLPGLVLRIEGAGGQLVEQRLALDGRGLQWQAVELPLEEFAGGAARLTWELLPEPGGLRACVLAEVSLWSPVARPPAVLLVTSDTHRADHVAADPGAVDISTPTLDGLAARGVLFSNCFSTTNETNPSHAALMTGRHPRDLGLRGNSQSLARQAATLAARFGAAGFLTQAIVSVRHLGHLVSGLGLGFDRMSWPALNERTADETVALAEHALGEAAERPLFLWVHLFDAHSPYDPPEAFAAAYYPPERDPFDPSLPAPELPPDVLGWELSGLRDAAWPAAAYKGEVSYLDDRLGELLAHERLQDAVIAVTADHGESLGQQGIYYMHYGLYPDTLHVPLIVSWPGGPRGVQVDRPVSQIDLGATLLDLAGLPADGFPGESLAAHATDEPAPAGAAPASAPSVRNPLQADPARGPVDAPPRYALSSRVFSAAVSWNGWHLILHLRDETHARMATRFERHEVQLFDRIADPGCSVDLVQARPALAAALRERLIAWLGARHDLGWSGASQRDPELLQRLEALGYVQGDDAPASLWEADACPWCQRFE